MSPFSISFISPPPPPPAAPILLVTGVILRSHRALGIPSLSIAPFLQEYNLKVSRSSFVGSFFLDLSATYDLEFPRRTNLDYVLLPWPAFPALAAFTISFFVSFTDEGSKTYFNYYNNRALNEIFIYERNRRFTVRVKGISR